MESNIVSPAELAARREAKAARLTFKAAEKYRRRLCECGCYPSMDDLPLIGPLGLEAILDTVECFGAKSDT